MQSKQRKISPVYASSEPILEKRLLLFGMNLKFGRKYYELWG
jgi:hypothetical protein